MQPADPIVEFGPAILDLHLFGLRIGLDPGYMMCAIFVVFVSSSWIATVIVPGKYPLMRNRAAKKRPQTADPRRPDWGTRAEHELAQAWWRQRCARLQLEPPPAEGESPSSQAPSGTAELAVSNSSPILM